MAINNVCLYIFVLAHFFAPEERNAVDNQLVVIWFFLRFRYYICVISGDRNNLPRFFIQSWYAQGQEDFFFLFVSFEEGKLTPSHASHSVQKTKPPQKNRKEIRAGWEIHKTGGRADCVNNARLPSNYAVKRGQTGCGMSVKPKKCARYDPNSIIRA